MPLAVWACNDRQSIWWTNGHQMEMARWATEHVPRANDTVRVDFYLLDSPFMVAWRVFKDENGKLSVDPATGDLLERPELHALAELPPAHLLS